MRSQEDSRSSEDGNKETTTLYFGNLHPLVEQASLEDLCRYFGENQAKLIKDRPSGTSAGFGFVKFQEKNAAEKALLALNGNYHLGHELRVNWALPNTYNDYNMHQLFVGDLPADITDAQLYNAFCTSGQCSDVRIMWDHTTGRSKGYGFVSFHIKEDADNALVKMHGSLIGGRKIRCGWAQHKLDDCSTTPDHDSIDRADPSNTNVYVGNIPPEWVEHELTNHFSVYGNIAVVKLHKKGGYGFVKFCAHESAVKAIVDLQGKDCQGRVLKCSWGKNISLLMPLKPHAALSDANTLQLPVLGGLERLSLSSHGRLSLNQGPLSPLSSIPAMHPKLARDSSLAAMRPNLARGNSMTAVPSNLARVSSMTAMHPNLAPGNSMTAMHPNLAQDSPMTAMHPNLAPGNSMTTMPPNLARGNSMTAMHPNLTWDSSMAAMHPNLARDDSMATVYLNSARGSLDAVHPYLAHDSLDTFNADLLRGLDQDTLNMLAAGGLSQLNMGGLPSTESSYMGAQPTHLYNQNQSQMLAQQNADLSLALQIMGQGMNDPGSETPSPPARMMMQGMHGMSGVGSKTTSPPARMMMQGVHGMSGLDSETSSLSPQRSLQGMTAICMQPYTALALSEHTIFQGTHGMNGCARQELMGAGSARSSELWYPDSILSPAAPHGVQACCSAQQLPTQPRLNPQLSSTQSRSSAQQLAMQPKLSPQHSSTQVHFSAQQLPMQQLLASMGDKGGLDLYMGGGGGLDLYMGGGGVLNPSLGETYPKAYHADLAQQLQALESVHADGLGACGVYMDNRNSDNRMLPYHYR
eukprot:gene24446-10046_t